MGFIKHFNDDMPCTISDNLNYYFPKDPLDDMKWKEIYKDGKWYVCYEKQKKIAKFKSLNDAKCFLNAR